MSDPPLERPAGRLLSRRAMIRGGLAGLAAGLLASCGSSAPAAPSGVASPAVSPAGGKTTPTARSTKAATRVASPRSKTSTPLASPSTGSPAAIDPKQAELNKLYELARKEGKVVWWTSHYAQDTAEAVAAAFKAKYPGIDVETTRQPAQVIYSRLTQNIRSGARGPDIFASTDEAHYTDLKKQNQLMKYVPVGLDQLPPDLRYIDADSMYVVGALGFVVINFNSAKVTTPPTSWTDLLDPRWNNQITLGNPGVSGYVGNWAVAMADRYGWDYFTSLEKNNPRIGRSVTDTVTDEISGERVVGAGPDSFTLQKKAEGEPVDIHFPDDDAILVVSPVAIMTDAPHPNAAMLFESFYCSLEYSQTLAKTFNYPLLASVPPPSGKPISQIKWYRNKADRLATGVPDAIIKWRDIFGA